MNVYLKGSDEFNLAYSQVSEFRTEALIIFYSPVLYNIPLLMQDRGVGVGRIGSGR